MYLFRILVRVSTIPRERNARRERERMLEAKNGTHGDRDQQKNNTTVKEKNAKERKELKKKEKEKERKLFGIRQLM